MDSFGVPEVVVLRLPVYVRALTRLHSEGLDVVSSRQLGIHLQMTAAQIRKDLSYFGKFGKQGKGYSIEFLLKELRIILGLNRTWRACLVGVGQLGRAIISYPEFTPERFDIVAAFDNDPGKRGILVGDLEVQPMSELEETVINRDVAISIVAVPAAEAQMVLDSLVRSKVVAILNYAPVALQVPAGVLIRNIDPVLSLQSMTYYLRDLK